MARLPIELCVLSPDQWTKPFWEALREHRLVVARCAECGAVRMPPGPFCGRCLAQPIDWVETPGTGTVHTFTITRRAFHSSLLDHVPYVVAVIQLDDAYGARLIGTLVDAAPETVTIGMRVQVVFDDVDTHTTVARFRPTGPPPAVSAQNTFEQPSQ